MSGKQPIKVAIVHDWLVGGGAERVIQSLHELYPDAPIYTSYCSDEWREKLDGKVITGVLQWWPFSVLRKFIPPLRIWWFGRLKLEGYDVIISSSGNGEAKGVHVPQGTLHIIYCHAPTHFYWRHYKHYLRSPGFGIFNPLARIGLRLLVNPLRHWDYRTAQRPDLFIANSSHTQAEIKEFYGRDSVVIHPPIDIERFSTSQPLERKGFVTAGRQTPYKRTDLIVAACSKLGLPLTVIGRGPEHAQLVAMAGPTVTFPDNVSDEEMAKYLSQAKAFLFAAYEDFGVTPVEAMAAGTPVIAYKAGGAIDYVLPGKTGLFFDEQSVESLTNVLQQFNEDDFKSSDIRETASLFSAASFARKMNEFVSKKLNDN